MSDGADDAVVLGTIQMMSPQPKHIFVIYDEHNKVIVSIQMSGEVHLGEGFTADQASRVFWKRLISFNPYSKEMSKLQLALAAYRSALLSRESESKELRQMFEESMGRG
jgi:hypothetical protein